MAIPPAPASVAGTMPRTQASSGVGSSAPSSGTTPPRLSLLQNLSTQSFLINQLFTLIANPPSASSSTVNTQQLQQPPNAVGGVSAGPGVEAGTAVDLSEQIYAALNLSTLDLSSLVRDTYEHQAEYAKLQEKKREVELLENRVRGLIKRLEGGRRELEEMVEVGRVVKGDIERSQKDPISVPRLLSTAQSLARHSSAPVSSLLSNIDKNAYQPWPTEMVMRQGLLFQLEGSMVAMGERGVVGAGAGAGASGQANQMDLDQTANDAQHAESTQVIHHEESGRRYDPNAVFDLALNSDESDDE